MLAFGLEIAVVYAGKHVGLYAVARILDGYAGILLVFVHTGVERECDMPLPRIFYGIGDEIVDYGGDYLAVEIHARAQGLDRQAELDILILVEFLISQSYLRYEIREAAAHHG